MKSLYLFNTLSRTKEEFKSIEPGKIRMYSCGPTVYSRAHIGNMRAYIFVDLLKRILMTHGYEIFHVMNITDVGHLTSDSDEGADKMEKAARETKETVWDIAKKYTDLFIADTNKLHILPPTKTTKATEYIQEQIELVQTLEKKGFTYRTSDGIYFDTSKFPSYPDFARLNIKGLEQGARVETNPEKKNPTDFALWKFSKTEEKRQMEWESPWGVGFPGWHIECSAMSMKLLGDHFDIHTGGVDHIPVHHTNEIAQSECATGHKTVNYWLHNEFILFNNEKIAKSVGNVYTLDDLENMGIEPIIYKFFVLQTHYRKKVNFITEAVLASKEGYNKIIECINRVYSLPELSKTHSDNTIINTYKENALSAAADDLNSPEIIASLFDLIKEINSNIDKDVSVDKKEILSLFDFYDALLGLDFKGHATIDIPNDIRKLIENRKKAKEDKRWEDADKIRLEIELKGFSIKDGRDGIQTIQKK